MNKQSTFDTRIATDYLKGLAIVAVYINHFTNGYLTPNFKEYANGFVALFFILSGYGIYFSLNKQMSQGEDPYFATYFLKRVQRIFPLFWIWFFLRSFTVDTLTLLDFFGLNWIEPNSLWFVPAIIQCYLVAPLIVWLLRKVASRQSLIILVAVFAVINLLLFATDWLPLVRVVAYRDLYFLHILLFALGSWLAQIKGTRQKWPVAAVLSIFLFVVFVQETTPQALISFPGRDVVFPILFGLTGLGMVYGVIYWSSSLPATGLFRLLGQYSFAIYIFHQFGIRLLLEVGLLERYTTPIQNIIVILIATPFFVIGYILLNIIVDEIVVGKRNPINAWQNFKSALSIVRT